LYVIAERGAGRSLSDIRRRQQTGRSARRRRLGRMSGSVVAGHGVARPRPGPRGPGHWLRDRGGRAVDDGARLIVGRHGTRLAGCRRRGDVLDGRPSRVAQFETGAAAVVLARRGSERIGRTRMTATLLALAAVLAVAAAGHFQEALQ